MKTTLNGILLFLIANNTLVIFGVMLGLSALLSDVFFSPTNLSNLFWQVSGVGLIRLSMLLVILVGGIDLSVGSVMSLGGVLLAVLTHRMPLGAALLLTIGCGIGLGLTAGLLTTIGKLAPFIATLALMTIARGLVYAGQRLAGAAQFSRYPFAGLRRWVSARYPVARFLFSADCRTGLFVVALKYTGSYSNRHRQQRRGRSAVGLSRQPILLAGL